MSALLTKLRRNRDVLLDQTYVIAQFAVNTLFSLLTVRLITDRLAPDDYGIFRYVLSTIAICSIFIVNGFGKSLTGYVAQGYHGTVGAVTRFSFKSGLIGVLLLAGFAFHAYLTHKGPVQIILFTVAAAVFLPYTVLQRYHQILGGLKKFRQDLILNSTCIAAAFIGAVLVLYVFRKGVLCFGVTNLLIQACFFTACFVYAARQLRNKKIDSGYMRHGMTLSAIGLGSQILGPGIQMYMNWALGPAALAFYVIAFRLAAQATDASKPLMKPIAVRLTRRGRQGHGRAVLSIAPLALVMGLVLYAGFFIAIQFIGPFIVKQPYGISLFYAKVYGLVIILHPLFSLLNLNVVFEKNNRAYAIALYGEQAGRLVGYFCLIPSMGVMGVIVTHVIMYALKVCALLLFVRADVRCQPQPTPALA